MSLSLVRKEVREHGWVLFASFLFSMFMLVGLMRLSDRSGGRFIGLRNFLISMGLLNSFVAANRLLAREYAGRTQLFLEVLPIGRARVFWIKWSLGWLFVSLTTWLAWWANLKWLRSTEALAGPVALRILLLSLCFALVGWSFCAMAGVLGRYRYLASAGTLLVLVAVGTTTGTPAFEMPVLRLLGEAFTMARPETSWDSVYEALFLVGLFTSAAALLALLGSGGMASALAKRMTAREKVFVWVAVLAGLTVLTALEDKHKKPPFALAGAEYAETRSGRIGVLPSEDFSVERARVLAQQLASDVESAATAFAISEVGSIFVLPQRGLDPWIIEQATLAGTEGIVARSSVDVPPQWLRTHVLHSLLGKHTHGRAMREDRHVLLDGLSAWWSAREDPEARALWWQRAAASRLPIARHTLLRWDETAEQLGDCIASGFAFATVDTLVEKLGESRAHEFFRALFRVSPADVRALFESSPESVLEEAGLSWHTLAEAAEAKRRSTRQRGSEQLRGHEALAANLEVSRKEGRGTTVQARLSGADAYWVSYALLDPWATQAYTLSRLDVRGPQATLPLSLPRAGRLFAAVEVDDPVLACPLRVHARRIELP